MVRYYSARPTLDQATDGGNEVRERLARPTDELAAEPPAEVQQAMEIYKQIGLTGDDEEQVRLMMQSLDIATDQFYAIGTVLEPNAFGLCQTALNSLSAACSRLV